MSVAGQHQLQMQEYSFLARHLITYDVHHREQNAVAGLAGDCTPEALPAL